MGQMTIKKFLSEEVLYKKIPKNDLLGNLLMFGETLDLYCSKCGSLSTFASQQIDKGDGVGTGRSKSSSRDISKSRNKSKPEEKIEVLTFSCAREKEHKVYFIVKIDENSVSKIGEYPSSSDRYFSEFVKYRKELQEYSREFRIAVMLHSHGLGIGSFVYLRRVFEKVINDTATRKHNKENEWSFDEWKKLNRIEDKIDALKNELPEFLVKNSKLYKILSAGIHELSEEDCSLYFDVVKRGIEQILDDKINMEIKVARDNKASGQISNVIDKIGGSAQ